MKSFLVVGGGFMGTASALRLQAAGFDVTLIDPGDPRRAASFGNIGCIAAEQVQPWASRDNLLSFPSQLFAFGGALDFRWRDVGLWLPWSMRFMAATNPRQFARGEAALTALLSEALPAWKRIAALAEAPQILRESGHALVWMKPAAAAAGLALWRRMPTGSATFRELTPDELARYGAMMPTAPAGGILFSGTGQVSEPQAARSALREAFRKRGGKIANAQALAIEANANQIIVRCEGDETFDADAALVSSGAWSRQLMKSLGVDAPLIGERGYSIQSAEHSWPDDMPPTVFEEKSMVVSRFSSGLRASSFLEFGDPNAPGDPRKWRKLQTNLRELGVAFSETPDRWVGPRPTLPDYVPAIGRLDHAPRVFYAFGHQHLGVTLSAITSELIEALALQQKPNLDLTSMRIERFSAQ